MDFTGRFTSSFLVTTLVVAMFAVGEPVSGGWFAQDSATSKSKKRPTTFWPDEVDWDDSVPTPRQHFGFEVGFRHLDHAQIASYMNVLAQASDRITIQEYAKTHGGRPLLLLTITSPGNHKNLKQIRQQSKRLTKPGSHKVDIESLPAVINMGYGVHGDESSATNCSPLVAHYLAAAQGPEIEKLLKNVVVLLDPSLNPDGFNRFANWANRYRGKILNPDPQHAEHNQQWPPGRVNYYWFDLNRDWLPLVHPESQGRMRWYHQWKPNVVLDYHEMGTNSTYFFQPGIPARKNPYTPNRNVELTEKFGEYHAAALDNRGSLYFTQESFDDFYMGKGSTYPDLHGAVGILFEQASSRGHVQKNQDGLLRFPETIANHFATSLSSLKATVDLRTELHEHKRDFYKEALEMGADSKTKAYAFSAPHNMARVQEFARVLRQHDIQCYRLKESLDCENFTVDAKWSIIVPAGQPEFRFLKSLLMRSTHFKENIFYDVSSWTLSLAYGMEHRSLKKEIGIDQLVPFPRKPQGESEFQFESSDVAYLIDWRNDAAQRTLATLLKRGIKVRVAKNPFAYQMGDQTTEFVRGTLQIPMGVQRNKSKVIQQILSAAVAKGVSVTAVNTGLTTKGIDLGSSNFPVIEAPKIAMLTGKPVSAYGAGEIWHLLDTRIGLPVSMIKSSSLARTDLAGYTTLVLPSGSYGRLSEADWEKVSSFVSGGGNLIAVGGSAGSVAESILDSTEIEMAAPEDEKEEGAEPGTIQKPFDSASTDRALKLISGAIFRTQVDLTHPLAYGLQRKQLAVFRNHANFLKPSSNVYRNPFIYHLKSPLMAGYCSPENVERFKGAASVVVHTHGSGRIILCSDNPNFRGFWVGTSRIFSNAVFFGDFVGGGR